MSYLYYPGCSLKSTGRAYEESILPVFKKLGAPLTELDDWNCCGATAYMAVSELKAFALCARNFALAERQTEGDGPTDLVVPCAACFLGLTKARKYLDQYPDLRQRVNAALDPAGLQYNHRTRIRHPLDVLVNDIGPDKIKEATTRPLDGLRVACYYGCQLVRPYADFDDQHEPTTMNRILEAMGATIVDWPLKTRCCGGSLTGTVPDVGLRLSYILLAEAKKRGCDVIATACPLCQFNLECYQSKISSRFGKDIELPVAYFTQLMGIAMGIGRKELGLHRLFVPVRPVHELSTQGGAHVNG